MDLNLSTLISPSLRARLRQADPRTLDTAKLRQALPSIDLPHMELPHLDRSQLPAVGDAGKVAAGAMSDAGRLVSSVLESASGHIHDLRMTVAPPPKRTSNVQRGVVAVAVASVVGSIAAAVAFFLHPVSGAARRAALRRRLRVPAGMARNGVDTARYVAKAATERATDLVRIPVDSARQLVGSHSGHADPATDETVDVAVLLIEPDADASTASVDEAVASATAADQAPGSWPEADAEPALVGAANGNGRSRGKKDHAKAQEGTQPEAVGE